MRTEQRLSEMVCPAKKKEQTSESHYLSNQDVKLYIHNRRYLGSKFKLLPFIGKVVERHCPHVQVVADLFAGTGVVADYFNKRGKTVIVNDILYSNYLSYWTWFSPDPVDWVKMERLIDYFNEVHPTGDNYVSRHFGGTYFTVENARKIGFIREEIEKMSDLLSFREKAILITSLLYAMDKVANTTGHYDAYRRTLDNIKAIHLLVPERNDQWNQGNQIYKMDANELARIIRADLVYIDTPYNSRQYSDAYHLLENVAEWKKPKVVGVAKKMADRSHLKSAYCTMKAPLAFADLIQHLDCRYILVSYNNMAQKGDGRSNAKISAEEIIEILSARGEVKVFETDFNPYTTGKSFIKDHKELLYLCQIR